MAKNGKTLGVGEIEDTKKILADDLEKVQGKLQEVERMKVQLQAQAQAINGAMQQCDVFLNQLGESNPDSSIPSQDDNAAVNEALS